MKRIFLDTNVLIDYIDNRQGADEAELIFLRHSSFHFGGFCRAVRTFALIYNSTYRFLIFRN